MKIMNIKHNMKVVLLSAVTLMGGGVLFTSCEDMFTTENGLYTTDLTPKDTVYTMMGIVRNMQRIMDRTIIFGELRGDLVDISANTPSDLRDIANFEVSEENAYNDPSDFYSVINSCNVYLANVEAGRRANHSNEGDYGKLYFEKEIIATKCYRAWTYLELAKIYGAENIPFITEPIVTADAAEKAVANTGNRTNMVDLCTYFINDLSEYAARTENNEELMPDYSVTFKSGQVMDNSGEGVEVSYRKFFIPVRLMLAELYLWRASFSQNKADYIMAVRLYHEFLTHGPTLTNLATAGRTSPYVLVGNTANWYYNTAEKWTMTTASYPSQFQLTSRSNVAFIPMDTTTYAGNVSSIREIFSSKWSNNYYPAAFPSAHIKEISQAQNYLFVDYNAATSLTDIQPEYAPKDEATLRPIWFERWQKYVGDLRLGQIYYTFSYDNSKNPGLSDELMFNYKWELSSGGMTTTDQRPEYIPLYRIPIIYLHMAEALNCAGYPNAAFVILKYGLSTTSLQAYAADEFDDLKAYFPAFSSQQTDFTQWPDYFDTPDAASYDDIKGHNFTQWPIHALGSGESWFDDRAYEADGVTIKRAGYQIDIDPSNYPVGDETAIVDDNNDPVLDQYGNPVKNYGYWPVPEATDEPVEPVDPGEEATEAEKTKYASDKAKYDTDKAAWDANEAAIAAANSHNKAYKALARSDMQADVALKILTEEALEGAFEGTRFGDLMRYSKQTGNDAFLGQTVAKRPGAATPDASLAAKLASEAGWYITLPKR